jgi:hypothetical protein
MVQDCGAEIGQNELTTDTPIFAVLGVSNKDDIIFPPSVQQ